MYKKLILSTTVIITVIAAVWFIGSNYPAAMDLPFSATETAFDDEPVSLLSPEGVTLGRGNWYTVAELQNYQRPEGPYRVGIQVGHLNNDQVPEELNGLTANGDGATYGTYTERALMETLGALVKQKLEAAGIVVDLLPATVPPKYEADAFISLHADGNSSSRARGFKIAGPRRDYSGLSDELVTELSTAYGQATGLPEDDQITRRMTSYYAFNWPRYEHAVHPFTPSAIVETGFLTNAVDRAFLINEQEKIATGIASGTLAFLALPRVITPPPGALTLPPLPLEGTITCAPLRLERRGTTTPQCLPSLVVEEGAHYLLEASPAIATSSLPLQASVTGTYVPAETLENYFWFPYEVRGIIRNADVTIN